MQRFRHLWLAILMVALLPWGVWLSWHPAPPPTARVQAQVLLTVVPHRCRIGTLPVSCPQPPGLLPQEALTAAPPARRPARPTDLALPGSHLPATPKPPPRLA